jgi:amidase
LVLRKPATPLPHAFISYKAPKLGDKSLRLAVKDLIHIRERSPQPGPNIFVSMLNPAKEDAACLHIARKRRVAIVGKTNRSEFAIGGNLLP